MTDDAAALTALIVAEYPNPSSPGATIVEVECPHCGGTHTHGLPDGTCSGAEWRGAHCTDSRNHGDYRLVRSRPSDPTTPTSPDDPTI